MPTEKQCQTLYKRARKTTGLDRHQWARLLACGAPTPAANSNVIKKENEIGSSNYRKTNQAEALASELARYIHDVYGGDIGAIVYGKDGSIKNIPKQK